MSVLTQVGIVGGKDLKILSVEWHKVFDGMLPRNIAVIAVHIPCVIGYAVECNLGSFGMFHRIGDESSHIVFDVETAPNKRWSRT